MKKTKQSFKKILSNNIYMLKFVAKYTPEYILWMIIEGVIWGMIHSFTSVIFVKMLFDKLGSNAPFNEVSIVIGYMAAFSLITYLFHVWYWNYKNATMQLKLQKSMQSELFEKALSLDLACYDNPQFYTDFVWAIAEAHGQTASIMEDIGKLINRTISTATIAGVLFTIDPFMVMIILVVVGLTAVLTIWRNKVNYDSNVEAKPLIRKNDYISRIFYMQDYAKEIRLSKVSDLLYDDFDLVIADRRETAIKYGKKSLFIGLLNNICTTLLCEAGINLLLLYKLMVVGTITLGDFAASNNAIWKLYWQINSLIDFIVKFPEHSLYAEKFRTFMEYEPKIISGKLEVLPVEVLKFDNVSFRYDGSESYALKNISLEINRGEKIAIVGYNGAGKSTLIKLIMRLYDPNNGIVSLNDINIKEYNIDSYRKKIGAVFQDYQIFAATVAENVLAAPYSESNREAIIDALNQSTFGNRLEQMPQDIDTPLTREFSKEGINLSGGEAQKIAISRVFVQHFELIIMDEPSSSLDPMSEYELNKTILNYASDKTVIFISHRLSTAHMADRIYMFDNGSIIEHGSHSELMVMNGKYAEMFRMQAKKYIDEE